VGARVAEVVQACALTLLAAACHWSFEKISEVAGPIVLEDSMRRPGSDQDKKPMGGYAARDVDRKLEVWKNSS
jgi:hypothetical protein